MAVLAALVNRFKKKKKQQQDPNVLMEQYDPFLGIKGYQEEVTRLKSVAMAIRDLATGKVTVGHMPTGIMLSGSPGMGKTSMAKAFAQATGLACFMTNEPLSTGLIHELYETAKAAAPAVVLIDDIDKILPEESVIGEAGYASDESRAALKEFISQLDGLTKADRVVTVMTTNEYENLDSSLKRPGRVDVHIPIGMPNDKDREEILSYYMAQYGGVFPPQLAGLISKKTHNLSCSALRTIVNDVWLQNYAAGVAGLDWADCFQRRILEYRGEGLLKKSVTNDEDFWRICYHEAGHALVEYYLTDTTSDICVLQVSGSDAGGWTLPRENDETQKMWCEKECRNELAVLLGGLAAEIEKYGEHSLGAKSDIEAARIILSEMGFCDIPYSGFANAIPAIPGNYYTDPDMATLKDKNELKEFYAKGLGRAVATAREAISSHKDKFEALARHLHDYGTASGETVETILKA